MADERPVLSERRGAVGVAYLNRPDARNALSADLMDELAALVEAWDADDEVRCIVIAGNDDYFAAGGDIKMMAERGFQDFFTEAGAELLAPAGRLQDAAGGRGVRLRAGRRLRAGAAVRHGGGLRDRGVRPAGDHARA